MTKPRRVDVSYGGGHWMAQVAPDFDESFDCVSLSRLIKAIANAYLTERLIFVIDQPSLEGHPRASREAFELIGDGDPVVMSGDYN
jgi:hypothetical protein